MLNIKSELEKYSIILSVLPNYYYTEAIMQITKNLQDYKICYIDLNKGIDAMLKSFKSNNINTKNIFFIDGVTSTISPNLKPDNAILLSSPYALTEMGIAISEVLKANKFDILIFDSLSTLNVYAKELSGVSSKFTSYIINKLRSSRNKGVLTCLENDANSDLIRQSSLFVDKVLKLENIQTDKTKANTYKAFGMVASLLAFSFLSLFYTTQSNSTAMAVFEGSAPANIAFPFTLIGIGILIVFLLIMHKNRGPKLVEVPFNISERKEKEIIKNEFRGKINKWLKSIKALGLF